MSLAAKIRRAPLRLTTGAFILNSGISKLTADDEMSKALHGMAAGGLPYVDKVDHRIFAKALSVGEIALGTALLLPVVPPFVAGLGLTAFAGGLMTMWWRTPGMHEEGIPRPTQQGLAQSKDVWMLGAGLSLVLDALTEPAHDKTVEVVATVHERAAATRRRARRAEKMAALAGAASAARLAESARNAREAARNAGGELAEHTRSASAELAQHTRSASAELAEQTRSTGAEFAEQTREASRRAAKQTREASRRAAKQTRKASRRAAEQAQHLRDEYVPVAAEKAKRFKNVSKRWAKTARESAQDLAEKVPGR